MQRSTLFAALLVPAALAQNTGMFESAGDIGVTPKKGAVEFASGEYRITGGGANIWGREDAMFFVSRKAWGDFTLTADVRFVGAGAVAHRKAVLMVRQDLSAGSAYADAAVHGDGLTSLQYRPAAGEATLETRAAVNAPVKIRIERRGNRFTLYAAKSGEDLAAAGSQEVVMKDPVNLGLGVSSHDANILETAVFSNVQFQNTQRFRSKVTVFDLKTRKARTVYEQDGVAEAPNWSRDGKRLLINTGGNLYWLPLEGEPKLEQLKLGDVAYRCNNDHDFTRDGKMLAFSASSPSSRQSQVYAANADGSGVRLLTKDSPSYFHGWSKDGQHLAYVGQRKGEWHLFRVSLDGTRDEQITFAGNYDDGPEYSPDGKWIYFNSNRNNKRWDIWRIPSGSFAPGDPKAEQVTNDDYEDWFPHFSPDGKKMIVVSFPPGTPGHNDRMDGMTIRMMPAPGAKLKKAKLEVLYKFFGGQGTINVNSWSPDSRRFAFVVYEPVH